MEHFGLFERCALLMLVGVIILLGFLLKWKWIYSEYNSKARNIAILLGGVLLVVCSIFFYLM